jgi:hypothetical protein
MDTIQYFIKNKNLELKDFSEIALIEHTFTTISTDIANINKLSIYVDINETQLKNFAFLSDNAIIHLNITIHGKIEYLNIKSEIKTLKFSIPKTLILNIKKINILSDNIYSSIYIYDCIIRKIDSKTFYLSFLADFHFNNL